MNKKTKWFILSVVVLLFLQISSPIAFAFFGSTNTVSRGVFTNKTYNHEVICTQGQQEQLNGAAQKIMTGSSKISDEGDENGTSSQIKKEFGNEEDKEVSKSQEIMKDITNPALEEAQSFFKINDCVPEGEQTDPGNGGFFGQLMVMDDPVHITSNPVIMKVTGMFQTLSFIVAAVAMVFYAISYSMGQQRMDPFIFIIRAFVVMLTVYVLPYLIQDLLNINNAIVQSISKIDLGSFGLGTVAVGTVFVIINTISFVIGAGLLTATVFPGFQLFFLIALVIIIYQILKPIISLTIWWYFRLLMIMLLTILGPVLVIGLMLPQTSKYTSKWIEWIIAEVFSQTFVMLGFLVVASLLLNIGGLQGHGVGFIGFVILMYAMLQLLNTLPDISTQILGGGMNLAGLQQAQKKLTNAVQGATLKMGMAGVRKASQMKAESDKNKKIKEDTNDEIKRTEGALSSLESKAGSMEQKIKDLQQSQAFRTLGGEDKKEQDLKIDKDSMQKAATSIRDTMSGMLTKLATGEMSKQKATEKLADEFMRTGQAENMVQAKAMAAQMIGDFEEQAGLGWDTMNQIGKLRKKGDLDKKTLSDMIKADAQARHGMTEPKELERHASKIMNDKGFNGLVGDMTRRKEAIENLQNSNIGDSMKYDDHSVNRVDFSKKDNHYGKSMRKGEETSDSRRETFQNIAEQGKEKPVEIAGREVVNGVFDRDRAQGAVKNPTSKMNYQGTVKNGSDGSYSMMYANGDGKSLEQAKNDMASIGTVIKGADGNNYKVTGHTQHANGMVSMDVQKVDKNGNVETPIVHSKSTVSSGEAITLATSNVAGNTVSPASNESVSYVGAAKLDNNTMQLVFEGSGNQSLDASNMSEVLAPVGSVTTDGKGNYYQVTGHSELEGGRVAMNLQQIQEAPDASKVANGFAQTISSVEGSSQFTVSSATTSYNGSIQMEFVRTGGETVSGETVSMPNVQTGAIVQTGEGQVLITNVGMSNDGSSLSVTGVPLQNVVSIATVDTNSAAEGFAEFVNVQAGSTDGVEAFTPTSVTAVSGGGFAVEMTRNENDTSNYVPNYNIGQSVSLGNGQEGIVTSFHMKEDNSGFSAVIAPKTETMAHVDTRAVADSVLQGSSAVARSNFEYVGAGTVDSNTGEIVQVFELKENATIADHSVAQAFARPGSKIDVGNGVSYEIKEVSRGGEKGKTVSVRLKPSQVTASIANNTKTRQTIQQQVKENRKEKIEENEN